MRVNLVQNIRYNQAKQAKINKDVKNNTLLQTTSNVSFKGNLGRGFGAVIGALGAGLLATALAPIIPIAPIVAAAIGAKAGGDEGSRIEDKNKSNP